MNAELTFYEKQLLKETKKELVFRVRGLLTQLVFFGLFLRRLCYRRYKKKYKFV